MRPEKFRKYVCVYPETFDALVEALAPHPVFHIDSQNKQLPVDEQVALLLYRIGHYGNSAGQDKIHDIFGWGYGTVDLVTKRVLIACATSEEFRVATVKMPPPGRPARESAKDWVEEHSCAAWRDGWLMVDGTLVPLYAKPGLYGSPWFYRKSNYSVNVQASLLDFLY